MIGPPCGACGMTRAEGYRGGMHRGSKVCAIRKMTHEMQAEGWDAITVYYRPHFRRTDIPFKEGPPEWYKRAAGPIFAPAWAVVLCKRYGSSCIETHGGPVRCPFRNYGAFIRALRHAKEVFTT